MTWHPWTRDSGVKIWSFVSWRLWPSRKCHISPWSSYWTRIIHTTAMPLETSSKGEPCVRSISLKGWVALKWEKVGPHGPLSAISAHMHAQTMTMPIATWWPSTSISSGAVGCVMGMSVDTYRRSGNMFSPTAKRALGSDPTHHTGRTMVANQTHPQTASRVIMNGQQESLKRRMMMMMMMKSLVPMLMRLVQMPQILSRVPTRVNLLLVQTLACCPTSLGVDYQRDGMVWPQ